MRLGRNDFVFVKGSSKPSVMALRLTDKLFSKATLMRSTVHSTKDFEPLDPTTISAIKSESASFSCVLFLQSQGALDSELRAIFFVNSRITWLVFVISQIAYSRK